MAVSSRRILVTGARGMIGQSLVGVLAEQGHRVTAVSRRRAPEVSGADAVICDLAAAVPSDEVLAATDVIVHLAGDSGASGAPLAALRRINVDATRRLVRAAAAAGVKRFVHVSSIKVHGEFSPQATVFDERSPLRPATPYAQSRCESEEAAASAAATSPLALVIARPVAVFGVQPPANFARLKRWIARGRPLPAVAASRRSLLSVDSAASALALLATHPAAAGATYVVADPEPLAMADLIELIALSTGRRARLIRLPGLVSAATGRFAPAGPLARLTLPLQADPRRLIEELGWQPPVALREALQRHARHW